MYGWRQPVASDLDAELTSSADGMSERRSSRCVVRFDVWIFANLLEFVWRRSWCSIRDSRAANGDPRDVNRWWGDGAPQVPRASTTPAVHWKETRHFPGRRCQQAMASRIAMSAPVSVCRCSANPAPAPENHRLN